MRCNVIGLIARLLSLTSWYYVVTCEVCVGLSLDLVHDKLSSLKVYVYDLASQGLMPALSDMAPRGPYCNGCATSNFVTVAEYCAFSYGSPMNFTHAFSAYQGQLWSSKGAETVAIKAHYRIMTSNFLTFNESEADLFFIPLYMSQLVHPRLHGNCGPNFELYKNASAIWQYILQQPAFQRFNGSDHFVITDRPWHYIRGVRSCVSDSLQVICVSC